MNIEDLTPAQRAFYDRMQDALAWLYAELRRLTDDNDRYHAALHEIAARADDAPMEDGIDAGGIARDALALRGGQS